MNRLLKTGRSRAERDARDAASPDYAIPPRACQEIPMARRNS
ncbi:hypothetical protein [Burkholderia ubonensis]|nr:hypothetical protein [Burkholderia ubonensis]